MGPKKSRTREQQSAEQDEANDSSSIQRSTQESASHSSAAMGSQGLGTTAETAVHGTNPNRVGDPTPSYEFGHPGLAPSPSEHNIQRALAGTDTSQDEVPDTVLDVLGNGGQSLDQPIQRALEERMDADFSNVRIHTGAKAAEAADAIDAKAFTCGNDIVFNSGEYDPESGEGQFLLAHELAHVRQQTGAAISMMPQEGADLEIDPDPHLEREADETATQALSDNEPVVVNRLGTDIHIQRLSIGDDGPDQATLDAFENGEFDGTTTDKSLVERIIEKLDPRQAVRETGRDTIENVAESDTVVRIAANLAAFVSVTAPVGAATGNVEKAATTQASAAAVIERVGAEQIRSLSAASAAQIYDALVDVGYKQLASVWQDAVQLIHSDTEETGSDLEGKAESRKEN
ncbi:DUF4157 domain-containing protein [Natronolimnobius sp. AArcel1]|uniref:eCIS core domain-containing protein n=1 Tax=Natronolimnobius sp. AArcel1 TaxID=1679093 RepID=UPI0013EE0FD8|nr:DUF4157 domain-containing protein [Natronolimnobius sp. AArcel1]NGM70117.1 DUF4157 domain-containing protein [Natronolimnobius sp. AArcel1]